MVRDAGGIPVAGGGRMRTGVVFRFAGALVTPADLALLDGVRTVVDLREEQEGGRERMVDWAAAHGARYVPLPMVVAGYAGGRWDAMVTEIDAGRGTALLRANYADLALNFGSQQAAALNAIADGGPAAFGCATGKDRTGVLNAYLQVLLGASEQDAVAHYVAAAPSSALLDQQIDQLFPDGADPGLIARLRDYMVVKPGSLEHALSLVRERGGVEAFLLEHGLRADALDRLRADLVEPAA